MSAFTGGNVQPYWLGTYPITASGVTNTLTVNNTSTIAAQPTFPVAVLANGISINSITANTPSTFSTCMLSTGTYWTYCDIYAAKSSRTWLTGDAVQFWVSDSNTYAAKTATMWPDYTGRPYYQGVVTGGGDTGGLGNLSATYSGWLNLTSNSIVYNGVQLNTSATGSLANRFDLYNWSYQRIS